MRIDARPESRVVARINVTVRSESWCATISAFSKSPTAPKPQTDHD
jgi:hypothetical protein